MSEDDLIERAALAGATVYWEENDVVLKRRNVEKWRRVAEAVLAEAAVPAPITAEDVRAAERAWRGRPADQEHEVRAAYIAEHLNRRGETPAGLPVRARVERGDGGGW